MSRSVQHRRGACDQTLGANELVDGAPGRKHTALLSEPRQCPFLGRIQLPFGSFLCEVYFGGAVGGGGDAAAARSVQSPWL